VPAAGRCDAGAAPSAAAVAAAAPGGGAYGFSALQYGQEVALSKYAGSVTVVVNIASQ
jgi:hypothetical protein